MPTDVIMPQMGESIFEGTITKWLKKPGDKVQRDEPLFEISTDKVDAEIPAPASGVLQEIKVAEGNTVQVNTVVGVIGGEGDAAAAPPKATAAAPAPEKKAAPCRTRSSSTAGSGARTARSREEQEEDEDVRSSPLVRKLAREHNVNLGTGAGDRQRRPHHQAGYSRLRRPFFESSCARAGSDALTAACPGLDSGRCCPNVADAQDHRPADDRIAPTSAHVHCMFEIDLTRIVNLPTNSSPDSNSATARASPSCRSFAGGDHCLQQFPIVNASLDGDNIRYHKHVNAGIAVALDWGLIVPVLKNADELNFLGLQRGITDLGERARTKNSCPPMSKAQPLRSPTRASSEQCSDCRSSTSRTRRSWALGESQNSRWSLQIRMETTPLRSAPSCILRSATIIA